MRAAQARQIIGARMRELRGSAGASLRNCAELSGWDKGHLSRVERGSIRPSHQLVEWYDVTFGAAGALVHQFRDLRDAVRQDQETTLRDARVRRQCQSGAVATAPVVANGSVPTDFDPADRSVLISENPPGGALVAPGQPFCKTWTIRNAGAVPWRNRWLTRMGAPGVPGWLHSPRCIQLPDTEPGAEVTITVSMRPSGTSGAATAYFKITDSAGRLYFPGAASLPLSCTVITPHWLESETQSG